MDRQRERDDGSEQIQGDRDGVSTAVLSGLSAKRGKMVNIVRPYVTPATRKKMSSHERFVSAWAKTASYLCVCLLSNLRKMVRLSAVSSVKAFRTPVHCSHLGVVCRIFTVTCIRHHKLAIQEFKTVAKVNLSHVKTNLHYKTFLMLDEISPKFLGRKGQS